MRTKLPVLMLPVLVADVLYGCTSSPEATGPSITPAATPVTTQVAPPPTPRQVRAHLAQGVKDAPDDPLPLLELALFDKHTKNLALAESELLECWKKFPRFARAPYHLGLLYLLQGRNSLALIPLRAAASLDKTDPLIQLNAGLVSDHAGMESEARSYAEAAIRIDPQYSDPYLLLARIDERQKSTQRAIQNVEKYLKLSPAPAPGCCLMGRIHTRRADLKQAEIWLRRAVEADPNNPDFWTILGRVYTELAGGPRMQDGFQCFQKALEINPNHVPTHRYYGLALNRSQQYVEAIPHLQAAMSGMNDPGPLYYDLGQGLIKAGRTQEGAEALAKYREYRASHPESQTKVVYPMRVDVYYP
jgi:tetratricopeptide (TPR) repeat protein